MSVLLELQQQVNHEYNVLGEQINPKHIGEHKYTLREVGSLIPSPGQPMIGQVVQKNWEEGVGEIYGAIERIKREFNWVYLPNKILWVNNSTFSGEHKVIMDPLLEVALTKSSPEGAHTLHPHPPHSLSRSTGALKKKEIISLAKGALPTYRAIFSDLRSRWYLFTQMRNRFAIDLSVTDHIISYYGMTTYQLTQEAKKKTVLEVAQGQISVDVTKDVSDTPRQILDSLGLLSELVKARTFPYKDYERAYTFAFQQMRDIP